MPLVHIALRAGKPEAYLQAIFDSLYQALREAMAVPEDDQFMTITEHGAATFRYGRSYLGIARSDDLVYIQVTVFNTRTAEHYFCSVCGIYTYHQRRSNPAEYGYNLACLEGVNPFDLGEVPTRDGVHHPADTVAD